MSRLKWLLANHRSKLQLLPIPSNEAVRKGKVSDMAGKKAHPGFKAIQAKIQGEGYSKAAAGAILANSSRKASPAAKKANPHLGKVKGK
jgi:hypothetical protein